MPATCMCFGHTPMTIFRETHYKLYITYALRTNSDVRITSFKMYDLKRESNIKLCAKCK